jgi:hypothetical protein
VRYRSRREDALGGGDCTSVERTRPRLVRFRLADNLPGAPGGPADPNGTSGAEGERTMRVWGSPASHSPRLGVPAAWGGGRHSLGSCPQSPTVVIPPQAPFSEVYLLPRPSSSCDDAAHGQLGPGCLVWHRSRRLRAALPLARRWRCDALVRALLHRQLSRRWRVLVRRPSTSRRARARRSWRPG